MPGIEHLEAKIAELREIAEELDASKRDARSTLKLLQKERRDTEVYMRTIVKDMIDESVGRLVKAELDILGPKMREHTSGIYDKINDEVDNLINLSLGEPFSKKENRKDLRPLLAENLRIWILEIIRQQGLPIE